jgi:predicted nucleotidyltransferase
VSEQPNRIEREVAEAILQRLVERAGEINAEEKYVWRILRLEVFGSMLDPNAATVGDIDIAIETEPKSKKRGEYIALAKSAWKRAPKGSQFWDWPEDEVLNHLLAGSDVISLHYHPDPEVRRWPGEVVFEDELPSPDITF